MHLLAQPLKNPSDAKRGAEKKPCDLCTESLNNARLCNATIFAALSKHLAFVGVRFLITALSNVCAHTHTQTGLE